MPPETPDFDGASSRAAPVRIMFRCEHVGCDWQMHVTRGDPTDELPLGPITKVRHGGGRYESMHFRQFAVVNWIPPDGTPEERYAREMTTEQWVDPGRLDPGQKLAKHAEKLWEMTQNDLTPNEEEVSKFLESGQWGPAPRFVCDDARPNFVRDVDGDGRHP